VNRLENELHHIRLHLSLYISLFFHGALLIWTLLPFGRELFCGVEYPEEAEREFVLQFEFDPSLELEFGSEDQDKYTTEKKKGKDIGEGEGEGGEGGNEKQEGSEPGKGGGFDKGKYQGTDWEKLIGELEGVKDLRKNFSEKYENLLPNSDVSDSYIRRFRHYEDMVVKEVFPTVHTIDKTFEQEIAEAQSVLEKHNTRNQIIEEFRTQTEPEQWTKVDLDKESEKSGGQELTPLKMAESERDEYLDRILPATKESQIQEFVENFSGYDPDEGDLPLVYRDLYYKNLQRLAYTFSADPTYFTADYFEENLNKEDYLRNAMDLISKMKGTKTATEILFTVLDIYEIQERAIFQHFQNKNMWANYTEEQKKQIRVETIRRVLEKYDPVFKSKKIEKYEDITSLYDKKKLQIMDFLLNTTPEGYRLADGHFEKGRLYFEKYMKTQTQPELLEKAASEWRKVSTLKSKPNSGEFLNAEVFKNIEPFVGSAQNIKSSKDIIYSQILSRMNNRLEKKRSREEKLLWKKSKSSSPDK
jgi:hypothetical protein